MKYKLLKKIEGMDWEVGEVLESPRYNSSLVTGEKGKFLSEVDIHNLLLNGTIEKVEENKRWRFIDGKEYFSVSIDDRYGIYTNSNIEYHRDSDQCHHDTFNYFQTKQQAQAVADKIKQLLKESHAIYN